jgi:hypothetical protein
MIKLVSFGASTVEETAAAIKNLPAPKTYDEKVLVAMVVYRFCRTIGIYPKHPAIIDAIFQVCGEEYLD